MSAVALPKPVELTRVERHHQERQGGLLKKAAGALTMRTVSEVEPTFLQRKAFNAMLHVARLLGLERQGGRRLRSRR